MLKNNTLEPFYYFDLILKNEPVWHDYSKEIVAAFSLLSRSTSKKRFMDFLESPFFVKDKEPKLLLFSYLYPRLNGKVVKNIRVKDVLWEVYKSRDLGADKRKLRALIKALCEDILCFNAQVHLEEHPEEMARLRTLSLRNRGVSDQYRIEQSGWEKESETLPIGTQGALHRWAAKDAGYMGLDIPKSKFDAEEFEKIWSSFSAFTGLQQELYTLEIARRPELRARLLSFSEQAAATGDESSLTSLYKDLSSLLSSGEAAPEMYRSLKQKFLAEGEKLDVEQRLAVMIGLLNYLQDLHTKGDMSLQAEMCFWPHMMLRSGSHRLIPVIPKRLFNNQLHRALINDQMWLAKKLRKELFPQLPRVVQKYVHEHNELAFAFHNDQHEEVIRIAQEKYIARFHSDNHDEVIRLKSYYLRSLLVQFADQPKDEILDTQIYQALKTLDKYIEKYGKQKLLGWGKEFVRYRRFRKTVRKIYIYLKEEPYKKSANTKRIVTYIEEEKPLACRGWLKEFVAQI